MRKLFFLAGTSLLLAPGCSLTRDFSRFHEGDAGAAIDAAFDAPSTIDTGLDAAHAIDTGVDAPAGDAGLDAWSPSVDAGTDTNPCASGMLDCTADPGCETRVDHGHCGACGTACAAGEQCVTAAGASSCHALEADHVFDLPNAQLVDLDADDTDRPVILARLTGASTIGSTTLTTAGGTFVLVALDATLAVRWYLQYPPSYTPQSIRVDPLGNIDVGGGCASNGNLPSTGGAAVIFNCGSSAGFLAHYGPDGHTRAALTSLLLPAANPHTDLGMLPGANQSSELLTGSGTPAVDEIFGDMGTNGSFPPSLELLQWTRTSTGGIVAAELHGTTTVSGHTLAYTVDEFQQPVLLVPQLGPVGFNVTNARTWPGKVDLTDIETGTGDRVWISGFGSGGNSTDFGDGHTSGGAFLARIDPSTLDIAQFIGGALSGSVGIRVRGHYLAVAWPNPESIGGGTWSTVQGVLNLLDANDGSYIGGWAEHAGVQLSRAVSSSAALIGAGTLYDTSLIGGTPYTPIGASDVVVVRVPVTAF